MKAAQRQEALQSPELITRLRAEKEQLQEPIYLQGRLTAQMHVKERLVGFLAFHEMETLHKLLPTGGKGAHAMLAKVLTEHGQRELLTRIDDVLEAVQPILGGENDVFVTGYLDEIQATWQDLRPQI